MRIAFLNIYNGVVERGSEVFVRELAKNLCRNHIVTIIQSGEKEKENYEVVSVARIPYIKDQGFLYDFFVFLFTLKAIPFLWREKFDWVIPINGRLQVVLIRLLRFFHGGKILISGHAGVGFDDKWNIIVGNPDVFVALSPKAEEWAKKYTRQVTYIPNGVDLDIFSPMGPKATIPLKKPIIFVNSALLPYKRIELAVKSVASLENASLLIIGDGPKRIEIENLGKKVLPGRFLLLPQVPHHKIAQYYRSADIFTLPSRESEAFGLVYLEALAANLPVVAPDDENRKAIIGDAGVLTNVENIKEYADSLKKALNTNWGDKPRRQAQDFSWERIASMYAPIFAGNYSVYK